MARRIVFRANAMEIGVVEGALCRRLQTLRKNWLPSGQALKDACGALNGAMPKLEKIEGSLSEIQAREVMVDFAFMNLSLKERPRFYRVRHGERDDYGKGRDARSLRVG
jgi:hypothetical protein